jgi:hypothetical protein
LNKWRDVRYWHKADIGLHRLNVSFGGKANAPYRSGQSKTWIKVKNPKAPAATRAIDGTF